MENPELRMTMYNGHVKHAKIWNYKPVDWHTWKFRVWPEFDFDITKSFSVNSSNVEIRI